MDNSPRKWQSTVESGPWKSRENAVKQKSFAFALRVVKLSRFLSENKKEFVLSRQLLRSGTAIGALVREAEQAESNADFVHKMAIALKEASETEYWLDLLHQSDFMDDKDHLSITADLTELLRLLTAIIKTMRAKARTNG